MYLILTYIHILAGTAALIAGTFALVSKKGSRVHRTAGRVFIIHMWLVCVAALVMHLPQGKLFLPSIALFTLYMVYSGMRSFTVWHTGAKTSDIYAAGTGFFAGTGMVVVSLFQLLNAENYFNLVPMVFGLGFVGICYRDLRRKFVFRDYHQVLALHMQRMTGSFIAAVTALLVVNASRIPVLGETTWGLMLCWFLPSALGSLYLTMRLRKMALTSKRG
ncbi:MAG: DUF2306 domain-containing protein [Bacteroidetes bacterium]|nr:DUF2306 domain-containing protein [Bacteroidota bacterium]